MSMPAFSAVFMLLGLVPALEASEKQFVKVYAVADLVVPIQGMPGWNNDKIACPAATGCAAHCAVKDKTTQHDALIKLVTHTVKPDSWADAGGAGTIDYFPLGMGLVVRQSEAAHKELSALLESLRRLQDTEVAIEIRVVTKAEESFERIGVDFEIKLDVNNDNARLASFKSTKPNPMLEHPIFGEKVAAPSTPKFLSEKELAKWLEEAQGDRRANVMQAPKVTLFNGQHATLQVGDTQNFVTSVLVKEVNGQMTAVPKTESHFLGTKFDVQGVVSADRRYVAVNLKAALSQLNGPVPLFPVALPIFAVDDKTKKQDPVTFTQFIQQPNIQKIVAEKSAMIPDGSTMVFVAGTMMTETRTDNCPPVVSRIPYVNRLFKNVGYGREAQSVYILVTPRVIVNGEETAKACSGLGECLGTVATGCRAKGALIGGLVGSGCDKSAACDKACPATVAIDLGCPACVPPKTSTTSMNLADVVALSSSGVSDEIIINQIQTSSASFTLATEDILFLKKNKVSDKVVIEMQNSRGRNDSAPVPVAAQMMPMPFHTMPMPYHPMTQYYPVPFTMPMPAPAYPAASYPQCLPMPSYPATSYPQCQPAPQPAYGQPSCLPSPTICPVGGSGPRTLPPTAYDGPMPVSRNEAGSEVGQFLIDLAKDLVETTAELVDGIAELFVETGDANLEFKIVPTPAAVEPSVKMPKLINQLESQKKSLNGIRARINQNDANERTRQLLNESEDLRRIRAERAKSDSATKLSYDKLSGSLWPTEPRKPVN